jgi:UDP-N-acetylglucosamine transferase subunit ALG13
VIFVTVGTADKGIDFTRLVREMDRIAGRIDADVLIQRGPVDYEPRNARHVRYVKFNEALRLFRGADLIVGHCGSGTVINAFRFCKPIIIVPRRIDAGELDKDNHQVQLAEKIEGMDGVRVVHEIGRLEEAVREFLAGAFAPPHPSPEKTCLMAAIREFLASPRK